MWLRERQTEIGLRGCTRRGDYAKVGREGEGPGGTGPTKGLGSVVSIRREQNNIEKTVLVIQEPWTNVIKRNIKHFLYVLNHGLVTISQLVKYKVRQVIL